MLEPEQKKLYYSIGEVSKMFDVSASLIRFWESEFDILQPRKNRKGNRLFSQKDIDNLKLIYYLVKEKRFTIEGAKNKLKTGKDKNLEQMEMVKSLESLKSFLLEIKKEL
jgi:DNA-binding transcriptional MerR regulator